MVETRKEGGERMIDQLREGSTFRPDTRTPPIPLPSFLSHSHPVLKLLSAGTSELIPERQGLNMLFPWGHEIMVLTQRRQPS